MSVNEVSEDFLWRYGISRFTSALNVSVATMSKRNWKPKRNKGSLENAGVKAGYQVRASVFG